MGKGKSLLNKLTNNPEEYNQGLLQDTTRIESKRQRDFWWVFGTMSNGKTLRLGKFVTEMEAENAAGNKFVNYEVVELPTSDGATASSMFKAKRFKQMDAIDAVERIRIRGRGTGIK